MKKKLVAILLLAALLLSVTACSKTSSAITGSSSAGRVAASTNPDKKIWIYDTLGIKITSDDVWQKYSKSLNDEGGVFLFQNEIVDGQLYFNYSPDSSVSKDLFCIAVGSKEKSPDVTKVKDITEYTNAEKIGEMNDSIYYLCWNDNSDSGLTGTAKEQYDELFKDMPDFIKSISFYPPDPNAVAEYYKENPPTDYNAATKANLKNTQAISFSTKDLNGNEVSSDVFKNNKITMITIWATSCGPCIAEMPDIEAISEEMKGQGVGVIGIVGDTVDGNYKEDANAVALAQKIVNTKGVKYENLIMNQDLAKLLPIAGYPTTLFVDSQGNLLNIESIGGKSKQEYEQLVQSALDSVNK